MRLINNKNYTVLLVLGLMYILLGSLEAIKILPASRINTPGVPFILSGMIILCIGLYLSREQESETMIDERVKLRDMKAYSGAFAAVLIYVTFLALLDSLWSSGVIELGDFFLLFPRPDGSLVTRYMSIIGVAVLSVVGFKSYYSKKGENI